jgi:hypothetical protein
MRRLAISTMARRFSAGTRCRDVCLQGLQPLAGQPRLSTRRLPERLIAMKLLDGPDPAPLAGCIPWGGIVNRWYRFAQPPASRIALLRSAAEINTGTVLHVDGIRKLLRTYLGVGSTLGCATLWLVVKTVPGFFPLTTNYSPAQRDVRLTSDLVIFGPVIRTFSSTFFQPS